MKHFVMHNSLEIPAVGFGTAGLRGSFGVNYIREAIDHGYRLLDSAYNYENEGALGEAIRQSSVARSQLFVTTKLPGRFHEYAHALKTIQESLYRSGLDYFDLYLIHWPNPKRDQYVDAWRALIDAQRLGLIRTIGVSNFSPEHIERLIQETGVTPAVNQIELHPGTSQKTWRAYHEEKGILTQAWSPLGGGSEILNHPLIATLAEKYQKNTGQIILRWIYQLGVVSIPRSTNLQRQKSNLTIFDFSLTVEEIESITNLDTSPDGHGANSDEHEEL